MRTVVAYLAAGAVIAFGGWVVYRVIRSWRSAFRDRGGPGG
jgi:hypothetical protein